MLLIKFEYSMSGNIIQLGITSKNAWSRLHVYLHYLYWNGMYWPTPAAGDKSVPMPPTVQK